MLPAAIDVAIARPSKPDCTSPRDTETVAELLQRLDVALGTAMAQDTVIDEVLPEIKRRRTP